MSPKPFIGNSATDRNPRPNYVGGFGLIVAGALIVAAILWLSTGPSFAETPRPIPAPVALVHARQQCPLDKPLACRAALVHALAAVEWQRGENLKLARSMVGDVTAWTCIHNGRGASRGTGEGSWTANTSNGYYGGLQMDASFERTYGRDMLARYRGHANVWPAREQIVVAQRAFAQGRGYAPWPTTGRACGLIR